MFPIQQFVSVIVLSSMRTVSGLTSRLFGLWTLMSAAIRLTAAYNIHNKQCGFFGGSIRPAKSRIPMCSCSSFIRMYGLALFSYVVVVGHYLSEWLVFKTSSFAGPLASPLIVGSPSLNHWLMLKDLSVI